MIVTLDYMGCVFSAKNIYPLKDSKNSGLYNSIESG